MMWEKCGSSSAQADFLSTADKADTSSQYLLGLKDSVLRPGGCTQTAVWSCWEDNLLDVSNVQISCHLCGGI